MSTKRSIAWATIAFLVLVTAIDMAASEAPNPYVQPPVLSLGKWSGCIRRDVYVSATIA